MMGMPSVLNPAPTVPATINQIDMKNFVPVGVAKPYQFPDGTTVTVAIELVSPIDAIEAIASSNHDNRQLRPYRVSRYATAMREGRWPFTGEPLLYDTNGRLLNGQHRLHAVIEAEVTLPFLVVRGLGADTYNHIDGNLTRSVGDALDAAARGRYKQHKATAARLVLGYQKGLLGESTNMTIAFDTSAIAAEVLATDEYEHALGQVKTRPKYVNLSALTAFHVLAHRIYSDDARFEPLYADFLARVIDGTNLTEGDPRLALRSWSANKYGDHEESHMALWATIRAWNAWVTGERLRLIRILRNNPVLLADLPGATVKA